VTLSKNRFHANACAHSVRVSAARHENFSLAAKELCLTESAISRRITELERYLDLKLFNRVKQRIILSEAGRIYSEQIRQNLALLESHTLSLMAYRGTAAALELAVIPTFAMKWLIPRLKEFQTQHPEITLNLRESPSPFLFQDSNFDAAIHFDHPAWAGVTKIELFKEELIPVISPRHYDMAEIREPADLRNVPLLHTSRTQEAWKRWFERAGCEDVNPQRGSYFELNAMLHEAARAGLGAALLPKLYVVDDIARGELAAPFMQTLPGEKRFCVVIPGYKQESRPLKLFVEWVTAAARRFTEGLESRHLTKLDIRQANDPLPSPPAVKLTAIS
jgi:LysR family transcriptional regulator, glycine cleavage system transcriptional activator